MSVVVNSVLDFYQKVILPKATRRNKALSLSLVISLYLVYYVREHILKPPKHLRHIPYIGYFDLIKSVLNKKSFADMEYQFTLPSINAEGSTQSVFLVDIIITLLGMINLKFDTFPIRNQGDWVGKHISVTQSMLSVF